MSILVKPPVGTPVNRGHPLGRALISAWLMNEHGGRFLQDYINNNHGVFYGTTLAWAPRGITNFNDGATYGINCGSDSSLHPEKEFSLECTFKTTSVLSGWMSFITINTTTTGLWWGTNSGGDGPATHYWGDTTKGYFGNFFFSASTWYHAVLVCAEGQNSRLYINGIFVGASANALTTFSWSGNEEFLIGDDANFNNDSVATDYEQVKLYNRALTPGEIASLYTDPYQMFRKSNVWIFDAEEEEEVVVSRRIFHIN